MTRYNLHDYVMYISSAEQGNLISTTISMRCLTEKARWKVLGYFTWAASLLSVLCTGFSYISFLQEPVLL